MIFISVVNFMVNFGKYFLEALNGAQRNSRQSKTWPFTFHVSPHWSASKKTRSSKSSTMSSFDSLPDEVALMIVKMAAAASDDYPHRKNKYNHDFLVDVLCKVSRRFQKLATDYSLWKGHVYVSISDKEEYDARKDEFVVNLCLNSGTTKLSFYIRVHTSR